MPAASASASGSTPASRPTYDGSEPLTLTESHLSVEASRPSAPSSTLPAPVKMPGPAPATSAGLSPASAPPPPPSPSTSSSRTLDPTTNPDGEREDFPGENARLGADKVRDMEKGLAGAPVGASIPGEKDGEERVLDDGTIVVDWDGEIDPANPKNWSDKRRMGATLIVAAFTFLSPASSSMIAPAAGQLAAKLNITSDIEISMTVSIFILAYAIGPLFLGPLSEIFGRAIVLQLANLVYLIFNLVCGFANNKSQLLAFRFFAGLGGSAPLAIGAGVLGDLWRPDERGKASALYSLGPLLGPALGPVCGGWIADRLPGDGYKWVFFSTSIVCFLIQILGLLYLRETYAPVLLSRKAAAIRKEKGWEKGDERVKTVFDLKVGKRTLGWVIRHGLVRPFVMLYKEKILQILTLYVSVIYGVIYIVTVSTTDIFERIYGESVGVAGTNFIALGMGFLIWAQISGRLIDLVYRKLKARNGGVGQPEFRLPPMVPAAFFLPIGLILYGWGAQKRLHWIVVDIGQFLIAAGMIGNFQATNTYLIDCFTLHAASALAASASLRSLCGFGFPLFAPYMFDSLGYGWGCTVLAGVAAIVGIPAAPVLFTFGAKIRAVSSYAAKAPSGAPPSSGPSSRKK